MKIINRFLALFRLRRSSGKGKGRREDHFIARINLRASFVFSGANAATGETTNVKEAEIVSSRWECSCEEIGWRNMTIQRKL